MNTPTFSHGVILALLLAVVGSIGMTVLPLFATKLVALKLVTAVLASGYALYLLNRSDERSGRVVVPCLLLATGVLGWVLLPLTGFVLLQVGLIWLVRALYHHARLVTALADLVLCVLACAAAVWALGTGSYLITFWCFFLVQALYVWIPSTAHGGDAESTAINFEASRNQALAALKQLAAGR